MVINNDNFSIFEKIKRKIMLTNFTSLFSLIFFSLFWGCTLANPKTITRTWVYSFLFPIIIFSYHTFLFWVSFPQGNYLNSNQQSYATGVEVRRTLIPFIISIGGLYLLYKKDFAFYTNRIIKVILFLLGFMCLMAEREFKNENIALDAGLQMILSI